MTEVSVYRIELPLELQDQTAAGARSATANLNGVMAAANAASKALSGVAGRQHQVQIGIVDRATATIGAITRSLTQLTSRTWHLTLQLRDFVTAPLRGVRSLLQSIVGLVTNPWGMLGMLGLGYVGQQAAGALLGGPLSMFDTRQQQIIGLEQTNMSRGLSPAASKAMAAGFVNRATQFGSQTPFTVNEAREWASSLFVQGFTEQDIFGTGRNFQGSMLKSIGDIVAMRRGIGYEGKQAMQSIINAFATAKSTGYVTGDLLGGMVPYMPVWDIMASALQKELGFRPNQLQIQEWAGERRLPLDWTMRALTGGMEHLAPDVMNRMQRETVSGLWSNVNDIWEQKFVMAFGEGEANPLRMFLGGALDRLQQYSDDGTLDRIAGSLKGVGEAITGWGTGLAESGIQTLEKLLNDPDFQNAPGLMDKLQVAWSKLKPMDWLKQKAEDAWGWISTTLSDWWRAHHGEVATVAGDIGGFLGASVSGAVNAILGIGGRGGRQRLPIGASVGGPSLSGGAELSSGASSDFANDTWSQAGADAGKRFWTRFAEELDAPDLASKVGRKIVDANKGAGGDILSGKGDIGSLLTIGITAWIGAKLLGPLFGLARGAIGVGGFLGGLGTGGAAAGGTAAAAGGGVGLGALLTLAGAALIGGTIGYDIFGNNIGRGSNNQAVPVLSGLADFFGYAWKTASHDLVWALDRLRDTIGTHGVGTTSPNVITGTGHNGALTVSDLTEAQNDAYSCGAVVTAGILNAAGGNTTYAQQKGIALEGYGLTQAFGQNEDNLRRQLKDQGGLMAHPLTSAAEIRDALAKGYLVDVSTPGHHALAQTIDEEGRIYFGNSGRYLAGPNYSGWRNLDEAITTWGGLNGASYYTRPNGQAVMGVSLAGLRGTNIPSLNGPWSSSVMDRYNAIAPVFAAAGLDPRVGLAISLQEVGLNDPANHNLFSIQGNGSNGSRWASYPTDAAAAQAFLDLVQSGVGTSPKDRYAQAWANRGNPNQFVQSLKDAGYISDEWVDGVFYGAQDWVNKVQSIYGGMAGGGKGGSADVVIQSVTVQIGAGADEEQGKSAGAAFLSTITSAVHNARVNRAP